MTSAPFVASVYYHHHPRLSVSAKNDFRLVEQTATTGFVFCYYEKQLLSQFFVRRQTVPSWSLEHVDPEGKQTLVTGWQLAEAACTIFPPGRHGYRHHPAKLELKHSYLWKDGVFAHRVECCLKRSASTMAADLKQQL